MGLPTDIRHDGNWGCWLPARARRRPGATRARRYLGSVRRGGAAAQRPAERGSGAAAARLPLEQPLPGLQDPQGSRRPATATARRRQRMSRPFAGTSMPKGWLRCTVGQTELIGRCGRSLILWADLTLGSGLAPAVAAHRSWRRRRHRRLALPVCALASNGSSLCALSTLGVAESS